VNHLRLLLMLCGSLLVPACELVARFDQSELDENRTIGPTPLPTLDGAVPVFPDGSLRFDGALVRDDTGVAPADAASTDAAVRDASDASDGLVPDADLSAPDAEAGDAGQGSDAGDGDAGDGDAGNGDADSREAGPQDAMLPPDLFADV
jgi:hypothetical protein